MSQKEAIQAFKRVSDHVRILNEELMIQTGKMFVSTVSSRDIIGKESEHIILHYIRNVFAAAPSGIDAGEQFTIIIKALAKRICSEAIKLSLVYHLDERNLETLNILSTIEAACTYIYRYLIDFPKEEGKIFRKALWSRANQLFHEVYQLIKQFVETLENGSEIWIDITLLNMAYEDLEEMAKTNIVTSMIESLNHEQLVMTYMAVELRNLIHSYHEREYTDTDNMDNDFLDDSDLYVISWDRYTQNRRLNERAQRESAVGLTDEEDHDNIILSSQDKSAIGIGSKSEAKLFEAIDQILRGCNVLYSNLARQLLKLRYIKPSDEMIALLDSMADHPEAIRESAENLMCAVFSRHPINILMQHITKLQEEAELMASLAAEICDLSISNKTELILRLNITCNRLKECYGVR
jgi:hypothetical protein